MPDQDRVRTNLHIPSPKNKKELQSFLGACNQYRRFMEKYAALMNPFRDLLGKNKKIVWTESHQHALEQMGEQFSRLVILSH